MGNASAKPAHDRTYDFRKRPAERPSSPGRPDVVPDSLLGNDPKKGADVVNLRWAPPRDNGGAHITGYLVERREMGQAGLGPGVWVRANAVLARAPRLAVASLEPGRRYQFRVRAENAAGLVSDPSPPSEPLAIGYQGGVATPPRFLTNLTDTLAIEESRVDFVVDIAGTPAPSICWYKDSTEIFSTRRTRVATGHGRSSLTFHQVGLADEGEIRCTATNKAGHAVTKAILKVEAPPHLRLPRSLNPESQGTTSADDGLLFHLDEVIRLRVGFTGRPQPEVTWFHNGEKLIPGGRVEIMDSGKHSSLRIPAACRADRGEYKVKAINSHGQDTASFLVTVTDRPMPPSNVEAKLVQVGETEIKTKEKEEEIGEEIKPTTRYYLRLSWSPPEDDGGCKIGSYIIEYYRIGWNVWLKGITCRQPSISLDNLIAGSEYRFRVKAENPYGVSDPSPESASVFLPDPKRGLMEAPEKGPELASSEWLSAQERMREEVESREREDEQRERLQRKRREVEEVEREEEEWRQKLVRRRLELTPSPGSSPASPPTWEGDTSPRADYATVKKGPLISGSSNVMGARRIEKETPNVGAEGTEFMLVLVPPKDSDLQQDEMDYLDCRRKSTVSEGPREFEEGEDEGEEHPMAPPMSLSAPVISGIEGDGGENGLMPPLRNAVSSSELLHERAMARIYQAAAEEEAAAASGRRGSAGASSIRRGSASSRRESFKERENWKELGEKEKEDKVKKADLREGPIEEREEERKTRVQEEEEEEEAEEEGEDNFREEEEESEEEIEEEEDEEEEIRRIEERDRRRAEAIRRQEAELAASEERMGGLSFGAGGRSGRLVVHEQAPPVPPHRGIPSPPRTPEERLVSYKVPEMTRPAEYGSQKASEDVAMRKFPTTRAPVPALRISNIEDYDDEGKALDPTAVVIGHYGDIIKEISSRVRKASPTLYLSREELKARAEEDFDPFEHGLLIGETEADTRLEKAVNEEAVVETEPEGQETEVPAVEREAENVGEVSAKEEEVAEMRAIVPAPTPPPPRVLTASELAAEERMRLIIDSFTTACLLAVASWLLFNGHDRTAAALVGLIAAKEIYKAILRRFPFLRRT